MANTQLEYPDLALDKFSDQDTESFVHFIDKKINFVLGDAPAYPVASASYTIHKRSTFFLSSSSTRSRVV